MQRFRLGAFYLKAKVEKFAPFLLVAITFAMVWALFGQYRLSRDQTRITEREVAQLCVSAWKDRGEVRQLVIDSSKGTAAASNLAILNTVREVSETPEMITAELEQILRENTERAVEPVVAGIVANYRDPTCDLEEARETLR